MAKARTLVGLDVHATKVVAAVLDAETGELRSSVGAARYRRGGAGSALGCRGRCARPMRRGRPGSGWRASCAARGRVRGGGAGQDRARRRRIGSRPIAATPSGCVRLLMAGELHAVRVPERRGGGAARPRARARGRPRRSDARPAPAGQAAAAPRRALRGQAARGRTRHRAWLAGDRARRAGAQATLAGLPRRDRRAACVRRDALEREIAALVPGSPWASRSRGCAACAGSTR